MSLRAELNWLTASRQALGSAVALVMSRRDPRLSAGGSRIIGDGVSLHGIPPRRACAGRVPCVNAAFISAELHCLL
jgi:hypothetical protein